MPEILKSIVGATIRTLLAGVAGWLIKQHVVTEGQSNYLIEGIGVFAAAYLWSLWQKYRSKLKFFTALDLPAGAPVEQVKDIIKNTATAENVAKAFTVAQ